MFNKFLVVLSLLHGFLLHASEPDQTTAEIEGILEGRVGVAGSIITPYAHPAPLRSLEAIDAAGLDITSASPFAHSVFQALPRTLSLTSLDLADDAPFTSRFLDAIPPDMPVLAPYPKRRTPNRPIFILSLDGGGSRGCVLTEQLCYLESQIRRRLNLPLVRIFDIVAGTSTGGLIATGLVKPAEDRITPFYTVRDIDALYTPANARRIFSASRWHNFRTWGGIWGPKYQEFGIESLLDEIAGSTWLSECVTNTLITAVNMDTSEEYCFRSDHARLSPNMNFQLKKVGRATSAAPTFFRPALIRDQERNPHSFVDGGIRYNNPSGLALDMAEEIYPGAPGYILLSLGTGMKVVGGHGYESLRDSGKIGWARPLIEMMMYGSSVATDRSVSRRLRPKMIREALTRQYYRTQLLLPERLSAMDTVNANTLNELRTMADPLSNIEIQTTLDSFIETVTRHFPRVEVEEADREA